jgi:hypothetical protein
MINPDVIGTIYKGTGKFKTDDEGNKYEEKKAIEGFHVNFQVEVPELNKYKLEPQPDTPQRIYAGNIIPVSYKFPDEKTFKQHSPDSENIV